MPVIFGERDARITDVSDTPGGAAREVWPPAWVNCREGYDLAAGQRNMAGRAAWREDHCPRGSGSTR